MSLIHKPGIDSGIDYGLVTVLLIWIAATIMSVILLATRGHTEESPGVRGSVDVSERGQSRAANTSRSCVVSRMSHVKVSCWRVRLARKIWLY